MTDEEANKVINAMPPVTPLANAIAVALLNLVHEDEGIRLAIETSRKAGLDRLAALPGA